MSFLNKSVLCLTVMFGPTLAKDPLVLLKSNRYLEAVQAWDKDLKQSDKTEGRLRALKGQALAYSKLGELYVSLDEFNQTLSKEFYQGIQKLESSPKVVFYLGQIDFTHGDYEACEKKMRNVLPKLKETDLQNIAKVYLHYSLVNMGKKSGTAVIDNKSSEAVWLNLEFSGAQKAPESLEAEGGRSLRSKAEIALRDESPKISEIEENLNLLLALADEPEDFLNQGKLTQINFYDPLLLTTISRTFFTLSILKNREVDQYKKDFPELSEKFETALEIAESHFQLGNYTKAKKLAEQLDGEKPSVLLAKIYTEENNLKTAKKILSSLENSKNPSILREVGSLYQSSGLDSKKGLKLVAEAIGNTKSPVGYQRYGTMLRKLKKYQNSLEMFAKGYKIQFRNDVEKNDPSYMVEYAYAIFEGSKMRYEEVVETMFHIQKAYPACRQMHYYIQGIAAAEARIYDSNQTFRKGG